MHPHGNGRRFGRARQPAQLNRLYRALFCGRSYRPARRGNDWQNYSSAQKDAQRERVRKVVVYSLGSSLASYRGSRVQFLGQNGSKVRGVVTAPNGQRSIITWHFVGPCKFVNLSIEGYGSLVGAVGKVSSKK